MENPENKPYYTQGLSVPETPDPGKEPSPWAETEVVGKRETRIDAYERVSGSAIYPSDVVLPGMLYCAILGSPHANAIVKDVDISKAENTPGVAAIITASSKGMNPDWSYRGEGKTKIFDSQCRYEGDAIAAVVAETPFKAWDAVKSIKVKYEVLPFLSKETEALKKDASKVHSDGNLVKEPEVYTRGDIKKGFSEADVVLEQAYRTECQIHTPLELHGCVAQWSGDLLHIWESTQGVYAIQETVAKTLNMPLAKVRVSGHYMGGGFGSKLEPGKYTIIASLLAKKTGRPVKAFITREETYLAVGNRPPENMKLKAGVKKDGTITALEFESLGTGGAYPGGGVSLVDFLIKDCYTCANVKTKLTDVYINAGVARPFRAPGHPQASWALEQMMDALAEAIGMDPVQLRLQNIPSASQAKEGTVPYTSTGFKQCLEKGAKAFEWDKKIKEKSSNKKDDHIITGYGMAGTEWFIGGGWPPSTVVLKLYSDGSANLNMGCSDIGTGTKTIMAMIVSEELGLDTEYIQIENADTGTTQFATPSGGSKTVPSDGPAVREAAVSIKQNLLKMAADDMGLNMEDLSIKPGEIFSTKDASKKKKITEISGFKNKGVVIGIGYKRPNPSDKAINPFGAQFCEVQVNTKTGEIKIISFLASHDSGRVMNRLTYDNQVFGGITMGIGFGTTEERVLDSEQTGKLCNRNWHDYKLPTALDVPEIMISEPVDLPDDEANSIGAKGLGEPVTIPTAAAIANAVYNATGVRVTRTPINPVQLAKLLAEKKGGK